MDKRDDAAEAMKARLRDDLRSAMKGKRSQEAAFIRSLIAAIDNAEAPPVQTDGTGPTFHRFGSGSAETERLLLDGAKVREVLVAEIREREQAAAELERAGKMNHAQVLLAEILVIRSYIA